MTNDGFASDLAARIRDGHASVLSVEGRRVGWDRFGRDAGRERYEYVVRVSCEGQIGGELRGGPVGWVAESDFSSLPVVVGARLVVETTRDRSSWDRRIFLPIAVEKGDALHSVQASVGWARPGTAPFRQAMRWMPWADAESIAMYVRGFARGAPEEDFCQVLSDAILERRDLSEKPAPLEPVR